MFSIDDVEKLLLNSGSTPPVMEWTPELSGDIDIRIAADGRWFHEGEEIVRHELVKLFASILRREDDGFYYLVTPVEKWRISVVDLPLQIIDFERDDDQSSPRIVVKTNVDTWFELGADHPLQMDVMTDGEQRPSVQLSNGLHGRVNRPSFYRLVDCAHEEGRSLVLPVGDQYFVLGDIL